MYLFRISNFGFRVYARYTSQFTLHENEIQSTKDYVRNYKRIMQNKPNFPNTQMNLKFCKKMAYKNFIPLSGQKNKPNQSQFKPNTNPISEMPKMSANVFFTKNYENEPAFRLQINKPNSNPIKANLRQEMSKMHYLPVCICGRYSESKGVYPRRHKRKRKGQN